MKEGREGGRKRETRKVALWKRMSIQEGLRQLFSRREVPPVVSSVGLV
jgi:hypothetical protein